MAVREIERQFSVIAVSRLYASPAWPDPADPPFINAALSITSAPPPEALLAELHEIERAFGRRRSKPNAPRTLDLDLLAYDGEVRTSGPVILPHPGLTRRDFVLAPLADIAPDWRPPGAPAAVSALLASLKNVTVRLVSP